MSLSLRAELRLVLAPATPDAAAPPWSAALAALERQLEGMARRADLSVTLSNRLVRYAVVPWQAGLHGAAEEAAYVRHHFVQTYGTTADSWDICTSPAPDGEPRLASAIDASLLEALRTLCSARRIRLKAVRPQLCSTFNRHRNTFRAGGWLVMAEAGCLCIALFDEGRWLSVRTERTAHNWQQELPALLEREACLSNPAGAADQVFWCDDAGVAPPAHARYRFHQLQGGPA